jgi:hypothetical protein
LAVATAAAAVADMPAPARAVEVVAVAVLMVALDAVAMVRAGHADRVDRRAVERPVRGPSTDKKRRHQPPFF